MEVSVNEEPIRDYYGLVCILCCIKDIMQPLCEQGIGHLLVNALLRRGLFAMLFRDSIGRQDEAYRYSGG